MKNLLLSVADLDPDAPGLLILHLGLKPDRPELAGRTIPGARYLDLREKFRDTGSVLPNTFPTANRFTAAARELGINGDTHIVLCDNVGNYSSPRGWFLFRAMGHERVSILDGGLPAWAAAGRPTELLKTRPRPPGNFTARPLPGWVATIEDVERNLLIPDCLVVDARSAGRFAGTAPEPRVGLPSGHMPGAASLPFTEVLTPEGRFRPAVELRTIFQNVNPENRPLICSCGSGITASILLFAHHLAYPDGNIRNFDGSWTEYATRGDLPIKRIFPSQS